MRLRLVRVQVKRRGGLLFDRLFPDLTVDRITSIKTEVVCGCNANRNIGIEFRQLNPPDPVRTGMKDRFSQHPSQVC